MTPREVDDLTPRELYAFGRGVERSRRERYYLERETAAIHGWYALGAMSKRPPLAQAREAVVPASLLEEFFGEGAGPTFNGPGAIAQARRWKASNNGGSS